MSSNASGNAGKIWAIAIAVGIVAFLVLRFWMKYMFGPAVLLAILIAILVAILLWIGFYRPAEESGGSIQAPRHGVPGSAGAVGGAGAAGSGSGLARGPEAERSTAASMMGDAGRKLAESSASRDKSEDEGAAAKAESAGAASEAKAAQEGAGAGAAGGAKAAADAAPEAQPAQAPSAGAAQTDDEAAPAPEPKAAKASGASGKSGSGKSGSGKSGSASKAKKSGSGASKAARKPVAPEGKPELLSAPRGGQPDDLKMIKGVGPKLEKLLHELGVYHFDQIASWRKKEVQWVDEHLQGFKGRVSRDEWVKQAKILARGGSTEFSKRVKKGKVY